MTSLAPVTPSPASNSHAHSSVRAASASCSGCVSQSDSSLPLLGASDTAALSGPPACIFPSNSLLLYHIDYANISQNICFCKEFAQQLYWPGPDTIRRLESRACAVAPSIIHRDSQPRSIMNQAVGMLLCTLCACYVHSLSNEFTSILFLLRVPRANGISCYYCRWIT